MAAKASDAVDAYLNRISDGIGWKESEYNGPQTIIKTVV